MSLSFREKSMLNRQILSLLALKLADKDTPILHWPGKEYYREEPSQKSLKGSIGHLPNPGYSRPQPPNAMGMVLLIEPLNGQINLRISGKFDVTHRCIPDFLEQVKSLAGEHDALKKQQTVVPCYRRITVEFTNLEIKIDLPTQANRWIDAGDQNPLQQSLLSLESLCRLDPRIFKSCFTGDSGAAKVNIPWTDSINDQDTLNAVVTQELFASRDQCLRYQVDVRARARKAPASFTGSQPNAYLVEIFLENKTDIEIARTFGLNRDAHLLDASFTVDVVQGLTYRLPHKLAPADYRHQKHNEVDGYGITTSVVRGTGQQFHTESMPISQILKADNPHPSEIGMTTTPDFMILSNDPIPVLNQLHSAILSYIAEWSALLNKADPQTASEMSSDIAALQQEADNIHDGISLLSKHPNLLKAFSMMNDVMFRAFKIQKKNITAWRLFQLGFIATQIRAIYERSCPKSEITNHIETAEVLWFATGGGKTEAYLGIVVMSMLYERIIGRNFGVTAWMKFPLRMLSVQQFQRLSYVVAQANILKQENDLPGHPFTIGYFTGDGTPSRISSTWESDMDNFLPNITPDQLLKWQFISDCPYCGQKGSVVVKKDIAFSRIKHVCSNPSCWSNKDAPVGSYGEGIRGEIGIYISDDEVYRYVPTMLVGTIDKLAIIGHNPKFKYLLGAVSHFCPIHGFTHDAKCNHYQIVQEDDGSYTSKQCTINSRSNPKSTSVTPVLPGIQFILQDELHLLSQNTGNFDAHYESTMQAIQIKIGGRPSKILSATATIKGYEDHIFHLYQRHARRFPVPGKDLGESFYSRIISDTVGPLVQRWYAGIFPLGSGKVSERASAIASQRYLTLIDSLVEGLNNNPSSTAIDLDIDPTKAPLVRDHLQTYLNSCLIYNNSIKGNGFLNRALETHQLPVKPDWQWIKLDASSSMDQILGAIQLVETKLPDNPTRQIIATSVVSHGVDMHRLNFLVVCGWPKSIAEYLQSSARSGRVEPGIVLSVFDSKQLYQTNVFLDFHDYHKFMDRLVESVAINRFAPNLLSRTLPGVATACVMNYLTTQHWAKDANQNSGKLKSILCNSATGGESVLRELLYDCLQVPKHMQHHFDQRVVDYYHSELKTKIEYLLKRLHDISSSDEGKKLSEVLLKILGHSPMQSLRDIESQVWLKPTEDDARVFEALARY